jgi:hypothetical protein
LTGLGIVLMPKYTRCQRPSRLGWRHGPDRLKYGTSLARRRRVSRQPDKENGEDKEDLEAAEDV